MSLVSATSSTSICRARRATTFTASAPHGSRRRRGHRCFARRTCRARCAAPDRALHRRVDCDSWSSPVSSRECVPIRTIAVHTARERLATRTIAPRRILARARKAPTVRAIAAGRRRRTRGRKPARSSESSIGRGKPSGRSGFELNRARRLGLERSQAAAQVSNPPAGRPGLEPNRAGRPGLELNRAGRPGLELAQVSNARHPRGSGDPFLTLNGRNMDSRFRGNDE